ncbi:hypothetical protein LTR12_000690 [Friedmanniomyces endolithicus]|nr:hypothetical protein LTR12_000690 [Friedmanniomyces endolithicus]
MLGTIYETAGTIPATIKTRYRKTTTAVFEKVKALFKKTDTTLHESSTPDLNSTFLWIDAHTPYHHGESRLITLPPADEHTDGGLPGWLSARDEDQVHPPASSPHIITTAPSPAYARFCREREDRRAKFQACLDYGSVEDLAEFEAGLIEDGLLQDRRAVLAHGGTKVEESGERELAVEEGVTGRHATGSNLANNGTEQHHDRETSEHQDATELNKEHQGLDVDSVSRGEEVERKVKHEDIVGG